MTKHIKFNNKIIELDTHEENSEANTTHQNLRKSIFVCVVTAICVFMLGIVANQTVI